MTHTSLIVDVFVCAYMCDSGTWKTDKWTQTDTYLHPVDLQLGLKDFPVSCFHISYIQSEVGDHLTERSHSSFPLFFYCRSLHACCLSFHLSVKEFKLLTPTKGEIKFMQSCMFLLMSLFMYLLMYYTCYWRIPVEGTSHNSDSVREVKYKCGDAWRPQCIITLRSRQKKRHWCCRLYAGSRRQVVTA